MAAFIIWIIMSLFFVGKKKESSKVNLEFETNASC